jgi:hypothetical protein
MVLRHDARQLLLAALNVGITSSTRTREMALTGIDDPR